MKLNKIIELNETFYSEGIADSIGAAFKAVADWLKETLIGMFGQNNENLISKFEKATSKKDMLQILVGIINDYNKSGTVKTKLSSLQLEFSTDPNNENVIHYKYNTPTKASNEAIKNDINTFIDSLNANPILMQYGLMLEKIEKVAIPNTLGDIFIKWDTVRSSTIGKQKSKTTNRTQAKTPSKTTQKTTPQQPKTNKTTP